MKRIRLFTLAATATIIAGCVNQSSTVNVFPPGQAGTNEAARVSCGTNLVTGTIAISVGLDMYAPKTVTPDTDLTIPVK